MSKSKQSAGTKPKSKAEGLTARPVTAEEGTLQSGTIVVGDWYWLRLEKEDADSKRPVMHGDDLPDAEEEFEDLTQDDDEDIHTWNEEYEDGLVRRTQGERRFVCVTDMGSNYARVEDVYGTAWRVHFGHFLRTCDLETDPDTVIAKQIAATRKNIQLALAAVHEIHQRLALQQTKAAQAAETTGLAVLSGHVDPKAHQAALVKARDEDLPALYARMKEQNKEMATWLAARAIPYRAMANGLQETVEEINDKVFNIELYAGLVETTDTIKKGKPAPLGTKLHLMQRMHYMDEECLVDYEAGGMDFKKIREFDRWLCKPGNFERLLPHARCMLAFRVRRYRVQRNWGGKHTLADFIRFEEEDKANAWTFLYIRNGERLSCLETKIEFQESLFPDLDRTRNLGGEAMYTNVRTHEVIPESRYDAMVATFREQEKDYEQRHAQWKIDAGAWDLFWKPQIDAWNAEDAAIDEAYEKTIEAYRATLSEEDDRWFKSFGRPPCDSDAAAPPKRPEHREEPDAPCRPREPYDRSRHPSEDWVPFDKSTVRYDDAVKKIDKEIQAHNRVALIIQGLFDRTDILHPHGPVRLWDVAGFDQAVELVYDTDRALTPGKKPDIDQYFARLRTSIAQGSWVMGQEDAWLRKMAERENDRRGRHNRDDDELEKYRPPGNPGPGLIAPILSMRADKCRFEWQREKEYRSYKRANKVLDDHFVCSKADLFHVSAYTPGDYKQFFADPRTRAEYLKWAPLLLRAEDWHAKHKAPPQVDLTTRKPMSLRQLLDRENGDPIFVRRTRTLKTKAGKVRKRGPSQEVVEDIVRFAHKTEGGPSIPGKPGWHYIEWYDVRLADGTDLHFTRDQKNQMHRQGTQNDWESLPANSLVLGDMHYEFFWPNRQENAAHKTRRARRRRLR